MRREILKWKHVVSGEPNYARRIDGGGELASSFELRLKSVGGFVVGHNDDDRMLGSTSHERDVEGSCRCGESRNTTTTRTQAEVPDYAIESRGVLQFREDFADERENHRLQ